MKESRGYSFTLQMGVSESPSLGRAIPQLLPDSVSPWRQESSLHWPGWSSPSFPGCNNQHCLCLTSTCRMIILHRIPSPAPSLGATDQRQKPQIRHGETGTRWAKPCGVPTAGCTPPTWVSPLPSDISPGCG